MALLEIDHLSVSFDGIQALQDVSLAVEPGQLFALVGPWGAGKAAVVSGLSQLGGPKSLRPKTRILSRRPGCSASRSRSRSPMACLSASSDALL